MWSQNSLPSQQQFNDNPALSGHWTLAAGQAISLCPRVAGVLHIRQGRMWATFDGPHSGAGNASGDMVLYAGEQLMVQAHQRVVLESWGLVPAASVDFQWQPLARTDWRRVWSLRQWWCARRLDFLSLAT